MGLFGPSTDPITEEVELATNENNSDDNWDQIIAICDKAGKSTDIAKNYLKAIIKRLYNKDPHIAVQAVTLLDSCVKNSGKIFHIEVASREFEDNFMKLMNLAHPKVAKLLREALKRWSENEFQTDQQLNLIPSLYSKLRNTGLDFTTSDMPIKKSVPVSKDPNVVESQEEEEQILKAIELSLKESTGSPKTSSSTAIGASSLYPTNSLPATSTPPKELKKVRALYDFEAAEDNELTFSSGEIIFVMDDSDPNWWKGSNQRGEGLFPASFVTKDLDVEPEQFLYEKAKKIVQFKQTTNDVKPSEKEQIEINEMKIDRLLHLLHEADPTNPESDTEEMLKLEREVDQMGVLIDSELEKVDRKHAQLTQLSADLVDAVSFYHSLMREPQFSSISKLPYDFNAVSQPQPSTAAFNGTHFHPSLLPAPVMAPAGRPPFMMPPPHQNGPHHFPNMPPPPNSMTLPPNQLPPPHMHSIHQLPPGMATPHMLPPQTHHLTTDERRSDPNMVHYQMYGSGSLPPNFIMPNQSGPIQNGLPPPPPQQQQMQHYLPAAPNSQPK